MHFFQKIFYRPFIIRLTHWEYWSFSVIYTPIYIFWFMLCLRARSFFFFAASNPGIENGGFLNESKKDIATLIPDQWQPRSLFFSVSAGAPFVLSQMKEYGFSFPLIGKPDKGGRGRGVKLLHNEAELVQYIQQILVDFHIQEYIDYPNEIGIFYYRFPNQEKGQISGIVGKKFLQVCGDGASTILELIQQNKRAILQLGNLRQVYESSLDEILPAGKEKLLLPYGNHARGAMFLDCSDQVDTDLTETMDKICKAIPGFYYGRLDIRYRSWEELKNGRYFYIIEVNGAGSEPTHIYDPRHSLFFGWKEIIRHWRILFQVSRQNHEKGVPYLSMRQGIKMFRGDKANSKKLEAQKD